MRQFWLKLTQFFDWWLKSLFSCLPSPLIHYIEKNNKKVDLIIAHHGDTIFIQSSKGKVIDSVTVGRVDEESSVDSDPDKTVNINAVPINEYLEDNTILLNDDQTIVNNSDANNIDLQTSTVDDENTVIDFDLTEQSSKSLNQNDKTTRVLNFNSKKEDDTIVISDNQEGILQFESNNHLSEDNTKIFCSHHGQIRSIDAKEIDSNDNTLVLVGDSIQKETHDDDNEKTDYELVAYLLARYKGNKDCVYFLPEQKVFSLSLEYPLEVIQNIDNVLRFDLEKHIPLNFEEIRYFYAFNINHSQGKINVDVAVVKSTEFDELNTFLEPYFKKGLICTTEKFYKKYGRKINISKPREVSFIQSLFDRSNIILTINMLLLITLLLMPFYFINQYNQSIAVNSKDELKRVQHIVSSINSFSAEEKYGSSLIEKINKSQRAIVLLSSLSQHINKQAWLNRFSLKNNEIRIKGEAVSATAVSDDLNRTGLFESIKFVSSIIKNPRNDKETFELILRLKSSE